MVFYNLLSVVYDSSVHLYGVGFHQLFSLEYCSVDKDMLLAMGLADVSLFLFQQLSRFPSSLVQMTENSNQR